MRGISRRMACLLLTGLTVAAAGCGADRQAEGLPANPTSTYAEPSRPAEETEITEQALEEVRQTLQSFIRGLDVDVNTMIYRWGDFQKLREDGAYDSLKILGKSNDWYICLWREGPPFEGAAGVYLGKYVVETSVSYFPFELGVYVIKGEDVLSLQKANEKGLIDGEAVYHMLPADMQWGLKSEYPAANPDPDEIMNNF